jgi:hypothetical protein
MEPTLSDRQAKRAPILAQNLEDQANVLHDLAKQLRENPAKALTPTIFDLADELGSVITDLEVLADTASKTIHDEDLV